MNRNLLIVHLKEKYGLKSLPIFYPDIYKDQINYSYTDIALLYNRCLKEADTRAIELLMNQYDLEEVFKIANCGTEKSHSRKYAKSAERLDKNRKKIHDRRSHLSHRL